MSTDISSEPIFVHSLWRAGSTYIFQAFRRSPAGYWAYQEPVHEAAHSARNNPDILNGFTSEALSPLRHPHLDRPYFYELQQVHTVWCHIIEKRFIYDDYFGATSIELLCDYFRALIAAAKGRPVIQECRTASRLGAIKKTLGGTHLYLWRNPWDQWWSLKVNEYFNTACQIILNAHAVPPVILRLRGEVGYTEFHDDNISEEFRHFQQRPLSAENSYLVFYTLWCLGLLEGRSHADLMINIDHLSDFGAYRQDVANGFQSIGISEVDLSDCHVPQGCYDQTDQEFFKTVEGRVHGLLLTSGYGEGTVEGIKDLRDEYAPLRTLNETNDSLARDLQRVRGIILRRETSEAEQLQNLHQAINEARAHVHSKTQQVATMDEHLHALNQELQNVQAESAVRERSTVEQLESVQREMATILQQQTQRKQEIGTQLLALQQQSAAEKTELTRQHHEQLQAQHLQREEHEWLTGERLHALNQELQNLQTESATRERLSVERLEFAQQELATLLHKQAQREQEISAQLLALQLEGYKAQMDLTRAHDEQKQELHQQHTEREHALTQHWQTVQQQTLFEAQQTCTQALQHLQDQLRVESAARQQEQRALKALHQELIALRSTFTWRLSAPVRSMANWFSPSPKSTAYEQFDLASQTAPPITPSAPEASQHSIPPEPPTQNPAKEDQIMAATQSTHAIATAPVVAADSLQTLLRYQGQQFVECAYLTLLKRPADPEGLNYYLSRLLAGVPKIRILGQFIASPEAKTEGVSIPGLRSAVRWYRIAQVPLLGMGIRCCREIEGNSVAECRLRAVEQRIFRLGQDVDTRFDYHEQRMVSFHQITGPKIEQLYYLMRKFASVTSIPFASDNLCTESENINEQNCDEQKKLSDRITQISTSPATGSTKFTDLQDLPLLPRQPIFYYYVDHTVRFPANTGIQRTVRMIAKSLLEKYGIIRFVKWDNEEGRLVLINRSELNHLAQWNGPDLSLVDFSLYPEDRISGNSIVFHEKHEGCWLLVPEVTHINFHGAPKTREVLQASEQHGLKSAFVFYDATPLNREELADIAQVHLDYMNHLKDADLLLSISDWSKVDFIKHTNNQSSKLSNMRAAIRTLPLPYESILAARATEAADLKVNAKNMILSVGSISPHKNQLMLVRAFNSYCNKNPNTSWTLQLVGHVHQAILDELSELVTSNSQVFFTPGASDDFLRDAYSSCAFTVFASVEEGFGLPIAESLWFGKPCVCANFGAMQEVGSKDGCILIDTRNEAEVEQAIKLLIENEACRHDLYDRICKVDLNTWNDYADQLSLTMKEYHHAQQNKLPYELSSKGKITKKKRIFWLGMHKILVRTELARLRDLGYEVFNPKYLSDIVDQSAELSWDENQETTLPKEVFYRLANTNFFYASLDEEIYSILNQYFNTIIVTIAPIWLEPIVKGYRGQIIYRVYGQAYSITNEFMIRNMRQYIEKNKDFIFMPHGSESVPEEANWFRENEFFVPYCLTDDIFGYQDSWNRSSVYCGEVALTCPNIANQYFGEHYKYLKQHYNKHFFRLYGVQTSLIDDPAVVGSLPRQELIKRWSKVACYIYTYDDPRVCYLPPIEMMVIGVPVLFLQGSLLDKYFSGVNTPARFSDPKEALHLCERIRNGDFDLIDEILMYQQDIRRRYTPSYVWPIFDRVIKSLI